MWRRPNISNAAQLVDVNTAVDVDVDVDGDVGLKVMEVVAERRARRGRNEATEWPDSCLITL